MKALVVGLGAALLTLGAPAFASGVWGLSDYRGADGGWLVFSLTSCSQNVHAFVRFDDPAGKDLGMDAWPAGPLSPPDFKSAALDPKIMEALIGGAAPQPGCAPAGHVFAYRAAPGAWRLHRIEVYEQGGQRSLQQTFDNLSATFEVKPGRTTYIGDIALVAIQPPGDWTPIFTDQGDRDLPIAAARKPGLGPVDRGADLTPKAPMS